MTFSNLGEVADAAGAAALLHGKIVTAGRTVAALVSGRNMDVTVLARTVERGLVKDGRLVRLRVLLPDHAGALHK